VLLFHVFDLCSGTFLFLFFPFLAVCILYAHQGMMLLQRLGVLVSLILINTLYQEGTPTYDFFCFERHEIYTTNLPISIQDNSQLINNVFLPRPSEIDFE
jgi:hypothetical protein